MQFTTVHVRTVILTPIEENSLFLSHPNWHLPGLWLTRCRRPEVRSFLLFCRRHNMYPYHLFLWLPPDKFNKFWNVQKMKIEKITWPRCSRFHVCLSREAATSVSYFHSEIFINKFHVTWSRIFAADVHMRELTLMVSPHMSKQNLELPTIPPTHGPKEIPILLVNIW